MAKQTLIDVILCEASQGDAYQMKCRASPRSNSAMRLFLAVLTGEPAKRNRTQRQTEIA